MRGLIAGLIVVVGAAFVAWLILGSGDDAAVSLKPPRDGLIREETPAKAAQRGETPRLREETQPTNLTDRTKMLWGGKPVRSWNVVTNGLTVIESIVTADGKLHRVFGDCKPNALSAFSTDQVFAMVVGEDDDAPPGAPTPDLGGGKALDREFRASLERPIVINEDDPETLKVLKERISTAREEMAEMLDGGMSFADVIKEARQIRAENYETRTKAINEYREILKSGDREGASEYLFKVNLALQQMGIKEIPEEEGEHEE